MPKPLTRSPPKGVQYVKHLALALALVLAAPLCSAAGNNYADLERKEQQRLEQSRRDHAKRQQDSARFNRENQQKWSSFNQKGASGSGSSKPGRMLDVKP